MDDVFELTNNWFSGLTAGESTIWIILIVLEIIATWRIFEKAGEGGWKSIIPIYNLYTYCKILGFNFWFTLLMLIIPVVDVFYAIYFTIESNSRMSHAFGHGAGYTLGLIFLNPIFTMILGFNDDEFNR